MTELTKLEAGKTYVFKDEQSKEAYLSGWGGHNCKLYTLYYKEGFTLEGLSCLNNGWIENKVVITKKEIKLFKLKEETSPNNTDTTPTDGQETPITNKEYNHLANKVNTVSDDYKVFYSYHPDEKFYLMDYNEISYKIKTVDDIDNFEKMVAISESLIYD